MTVISPTTKLEAVNIILSTIGETPVTTLEDPTIQDAELALFVLDTESRSFQAERWHFNTEPDWTLPPDNDGNINVPTNTLEVDTIYPDKAIDVVMRGSRLYDRQKHTYNFSKSLTVNLVLALNFEEMPEAARRYVTIRAARVFLDRYSGEQDLHRFTETDELKARADFLRSDLKNTDNNMLKDNYSTLSIVNRAV